MGQTTLIIGDERRRRWSREERARILAAMEEPGAVVADVARAADVCASLIYKCRRQARAEATMTGFAGFAPVVVKSAIAASASPPSTSASDSGVIVVDVRDARVRIGAGAPAAVIAATLKALRL